MRRRRLRRVLSWVSTVVLVTATGGAAEAAELTPVASRVPVESGTVLAGTFRETAVAAVPEEYDEQAQLRESLRLRAESGLRHDEAYVLSIIRGVDPVGGERVIPGADSGWWIPLTESEKASLDAAQERSWKWRKQVRALLQEDPQAGFAAYYLDPKTGQVYVAAVNAEYTRQRLLTIPSALNDIVVVSAKHTEKELRAALLAVHEIAKAHPNLIISSGTDAIANVLQVQVTSNNRAAYPPALLDVANKVTTQFGVVSPENRPKDEGAAANVAPPIKGGTILKMAESTNCTLGFIGIRANGYHALTTGHCGYGAYYQGPDTSGYYVGYVTDSQRCASASCPWDTAFIPTVDRPVSRLIHESLTAKRSMTTWQSQNEDEINDKVCMSGYNRNYATCGFVKQKDFSGVFSGGYWHYWLRRATYVSAGGDSGGPVYGENTWRAAGMHKASCNTSYYPCTDGGSGVYIHIHDAMYHSGITALYTAS